MLPAVRAAIYTRVSQDRSNTGRSVSQQETECRAICEREGWQVARVFPDNDRSASRYARKSRPKFEELRAFIAAGECDVLVTWEASRSTRDLATFVELRDLCRGRGVKLSYSGRLYDLSDDADQFITGLDALMAEQESARTSKRIQRSVRANAAAGRPHGKQLYGYRRNYDQVTRQLISVELEEDEAAMLRSVARRLLAGESLHSLVREANADGHRTRAGSMWTTYAIRRCMLNPAYIGKRVLRGEIIGDAIWPAMYDEETFVRLQALLTDPARDTARGKHVLTHLLSGIARCGLPGCGGVMRVVAPRAMYSCGTCSRVSRLKEPVDQLVMDVLLEGWNDRMVLPAFTDQNDELAIDVRAARESAAAKQARLQTFYDSAAAGDLSVDALVRIEGRLLAEIEQHNRDARRAAMPPELLKLSEVDVSAEWGSLPLTAQRAIIRHCLTVEILPRGKGRRPFDPTSVRIKWR